MKTRQKFLTAAAVCFTLLLSACGKDGQETSASSFSSVQNTSVSAEQDNYQVNEERKAAGDSAAAGNSASPEVSPDAAPSPGSATAAIGSAAPSPGSTAAAPGSPAPYPASSASASPDVKQTPVNKTEAEASDSASKNQSAEGKPSSGGQKAIASSKPAALPTPSAASKPSGSNRKASPAAAPSPTREPASPSPSAYADNSSRKEASAAAAQRNAGGETAAKSSNDGNRAGAETIGWSEFFDGGDQTRPSERFWDLSESKSKVIIKGFMGEVLSFEKHWFLLIPQPGAECPFDNGDETYWNKIMIVFVPDDIKLRHKTGPLQVTGRLEVGIKIDESGYKTMFRLYDASFEEIKE
ncbi:hypothetical protein [Paenibacillus sp. URB8-2]|uniref:hypothetical protein n=1 Tax=Paenibacillus sp. URB8-2 TaxID=2741301 RepID=UPI0015BC979E|nr:hypothetical protein [Paenibacillus sp. URB8-2]BCG61237.1 hypothetical protein PUR_46620 [Paenibacillus sp. URB8-2]